MTSRSRLALYGLSDDDYQILLQHQNYKCAICERPFSERRRPHTDHDHADGMCRGLLCIRCNHDLLGYFGDRVELYRNAVAYLENPPALVLPGPPRRHKDAPPAH